MAQKPADPNAPARITVGRINGAWGLRGHVKVTPFTSNRERFTPGQVLLIGGEPARILHVASPKGYPCVQFEGITNRNKADSLKGTMIEIDETDLPELPPSEYYVHDLMGLTVYTTDDEKLGRIGDILHTGANDVYVVRLKGQKDILIPAIADVITEVDLSNRRMTVDPLPGLLDR